MLVIIMIISDHRFCRHNFIPLTHWIVTFRFLIVTALVKVKKTYPDIMQIGLKSHQMGKLVVLLLVSFWFSTEKKIVWWWVKWKFWPVITKLEVLFIYVSSANSEYIVTISLTLFLPSIFSELSCRAVMH